MSTRPEGSWTWIKSCYHKRNLNCGVKETHILVLKHWAKSRFWCSCNPRQKVFGITVEVTKDFGVIEIPSQE